MKLDAQIAGRHIVRLHSFEHPELLLFRRVLLDLAEAARVEIALHQQSFIQAESGCQLTLRLGPLDRGIEHSPAPGLLRCAETPRVEHHYLCELSSSGWLKAVAATDLLLQLRYLLSNYVWLQQHWNDHGTVAWLLSPDGEW